MLCTLAVLSALHRVYVPCCAVMDACELILGIGTGCRLQNTWVTLCIGCTWLEFAAVFEPKLTVRLGGWAAKSCARSAINIGLSVSYVWKGEIY